MKFSFESGKYRDDLAKKLREKRVEDKAETKEFLDQERGTRRYGHARKLKHVQRQLPHQQEAPSHIESIEGFTVEEFDISERIPEDIQIYLDGSRLHKLREHLDYDKDLAPLPKSDGPNEYEEAILKSHYPNTYGMSMEETRALIEKDRETAREIAMGRVRDSGESRMNPEMRRELDDWYNVLQHTEVGKRKGHSEWRYDDHPAMSKMLHEFMNEITEGDWDNSEMLFHTVGGETEEGEILSRYPHLAKDSKIIEKPLDIYNRKSGYLWFAVGEGRRGFTSFHKINMICDPKRKAFQEKIAGLSCWGASSERIERWRKMPMAEAFDEARRRHGDLKVIFTEGVSWVSISKWIVDLYHGRLYKITENPAKPQE